MTELTMHADKTDKVRVHIGPSVLGSFSVGTVPADDSLSRSVRISAGSHSGTSEVSGGPLLFLEDERLGIRVGFTEESFHTSVQGFEWRDLRQACMDRLFEVLEELDRREEFLLSLVMVATYKGTGEGRENLIEDFQNLIGDFQGMFKLRSKGEYR